MGGGDGDDDKYAKKKDAVGKRTTGRCRFCEETDDLRELEDPCDCYKKLDALLCHRACLQAGRATLLLPCSSLIDGKHYRARLRQISTYYRAVRRTV